MLSKLTKTMGQGRYQVIKNNYIYACCASNILHSSKTISVIGTRHFSIQSAWCTLLETQANWFKVLSESKPVENIQGCIESLHDVSGLPWWATIFISTVCVRSFITLPFSVYQNYIFAKIENLQADMPLIAKQLQKETAMAIKKYGWTEQQAKQAYVRSLKSQWNKLIIKHNCHPFKGSFVIWVQLPLWICLSIALRNMANMLPNRDAAAHILFLQMSLGGFLWIPNLTVPDSSLVLPIILTLTNLVIIELQEISHSHKPPTMLRKCFTNFLRIISIAMLPIAANVPSCMSLYWTTSSLCGLTQNLMLMSPRIRRAFGIPLTPSEKQKPYSHIVQQLQRKFKLKSDP